MRCTHFKAIVSAAVGALLSSVLLFIDIPEGIKQIILHFGGSLIMIKIAFGLNGKHLMQGWCTFYFTGILMGGMFSFVSQYVGKSVSEISMFAGVAVIAYFLTKQIIEYAEEHMRKMGKKYNISLQIGAENAKFTALLDTGNMLKDNLSGKEVHIISAKAIKKFTKSISVMRYIPYQTVQGENKVMPLIKADRMYIHGQKEQLIENPYIAVSECRDFGNGDYEIILHPDCIQEV